MSAQGKGSPRPRFAGPAHIPFDRVTRHVWGDDQAGQVDDWIYVSSDRIHMLVFGLPPGGGWRHSPENRTVFAADELYHVLAGTLVIANPETGEVHRVPAGESVFFRRDTWHHGFCEGPEPLRVLEYFSPPPAQGTSQTYARTRPDLAQPRYVDDGWLGRWPAAAAEARARFTMQVLRPPDVLWRLEGPAEQALVGILVSTEHLTAGSLRLGPGGDSGPRRHAGDVALYLAAGAVAVELPETAGAGPFTLAPRDGCYVPAGVPYRLRNPTAQAVEVHFGVGPGYLP